MDRADGERISKALAHETWIAIFAAIASDMQVSARAIVTAGWRTVSHHLKTVLHVYEAPAREMTLTGKAARRIHTSTDKGVSNDVPAIIGESGS